MRISIAMLADELTVYEPDPNVVAGGRVLRTARLLADSQVRSQSTLYLQQNSLHTVACVNGNDVLFLRCDDVDEALNAILDVFDDFDNWSEEIDGLIADSCSLHEMLECIAMKTDLHLVVADATYFMHDLVEGTTHFDNPRLGEYFANRSMPLDTILRIDADPKVRASDAGVYPVSLDEHDVSAVCNLFVGREHVGWLVANRNGSVYTQGTLDFLQIAKEKIERWLMANQELIYGWGHTAIFKRLAEGDELEEALVKRAVSLFGWSDGQVLSVFAVEHDVLPGRQMHVVQRFLSQAMPHSILVRMGDGLMIVANESLAESERYRAEVARVLKTCGYHAGQSPSFSDVMDLPANYDAALVAARLAGPAEPLVTFEDVKLDYIVSMLRRHAVADVRHRALPVLAAYDADHATQLYNTLKCFVRNRGSYVATYDELFIHRSTLQYRLERIADLCGIDFDDPQTWLHLQLSFLLDG